LGSFALFNGVLEYSGPVIIAALFTVGLRRVPEPTAETTAAARDVRPDGSAVMVRGSG